MAASVISCTADEWVKVANNTKQLKLWPAAKDTNPTRYFWTSVETLDAAPDNHDLSKAFNIERPGTMINLNDNSDIYVMARLHDGAVYAQENIRFDVNIQDQTTQPFEHFLTQEINAVTLVGTYAAEDNEFTLVAGHGFIVGDFIEIRYHDPVFELSRYAQLEILIVNVNVITVTPYLDFDITDLSYVESSLRVTADLNVTGTLAAPQIFSTYPPDGLQWDTTRLMIAMILAGQPDDGLFGDIAALTNGIFFGFESDVTTGRKYLVNIRANAGFRASAYDVNYTSRTVPQGSYGLSVRKSFAGQDKYGVTIRLESDQERFVIYIQDDLSGLTEFRIKLMGHEVD